MMQDLAMHMLEILMNSIGAGAEKVVLSIRDSAADNRIDMRVEDNGCGMSEEMVRKVTDPFTTSRKTRKVGLGVAFMKGLTEQCGGSFDIKSVLGEGTVVSASVQRDHIDLPPMGDIGEMIMYAIQANENTDLELYYTTDNDRFVFSSSEVRQQLEGISLVEPDVLLWIKEYINEGITHAKEGVE